MPEDVVEQPDARVAPVDELQGRRVFLLSGIARPETFAETVKRLGAEVVGSVTYADHHWFHPDELAKAAGEAAAADATLLMTEKDDARLQDCALPRLVLRLRLAFISREPSAEELGLS